MTTIGVAIPTFDRVALTLAAFHAVYGDARVSHVAISDDNSDPELYQDLKTRVSAISKVKLTQNDHTLGSWMNKRKAVEGCETEWVALIDSDNEIDRRYLDALWALSEWNEDTLYIPVRGEPALDYTRYQGVVIDRENIVNWISEPLIQMALNTGNFFVHRAGHLTASAGPAEESYASDGIYFIYRWMALGRKVLITPNLCYRHFVHNGHWMKTSEQSLAFSHELIRRMREGLCYA